MRTRLAVIAAIAGLCLPTAGAAEPVTLRILFPEGWSVRQMADRVAEVRRIAIAKRHVTPVLSGKSYAAAAARAAPPSAFRPFLKRRSIEGFLAIDASLRYGLGVEGTRPLTAAHLRSSSPYNTHRFKGLPPTPITDPGLPSMRAAAKPAGVDYLYYLRKPNSLSHFFTASEEGFCAKALEYGYKGC